MFSIADQFKYYVVLIVELYFKLWRVFYRCLVVRERQYPICLSLSEQLKFHVLLQVYAFITT